MTLLQKYMIYRYFKKLNVRNAWTKSPLVTFDYYLILIIVCSILIAVTLYFADYIDNYQTDMLNKLHHKTVQNEHNARMADFNERLVVSMLNGSIIVDGRVKSLCVYDAAGECK